MARYTRSITSFLTGFKTLQSGGRDNRLSPHLQAALDVLERHLLHCAYWRSHSCREDLHERPKMRPHTDLGWRNNQAPHIFKPWRGCKRGAFAAPKQKSTTYLTLEERYVCRSVYLRDALFYDVFRFIVFGSRFEHFLGEMATLLEAR